MSEPTQTVLTPAQVEVIEELLEDRDERIHAEVQNIYGAIDTLRADLTAQIDTLRQQTATELSTKVAYSEQLALRAANGQALSAVQSNFSHEVSSIRWEWRTDVGTWESFTVERGHT